MSVTPHRRNPRKMECVAEKGGGYKQFHNTDRKRKNPLLAIYDLQRSIICRENLEACERIYGNSKLTLLIACNEV